LRAARKSAKSLVIGDSPRAPEVIGRVEQCDRGLHPLAGRRGKCIVDLLLEKVRTRGRERVAALLRPPMHRHATSIGAVVASSLLERDIE